MSDPTSTPTPTKRPEPVAIAQAVTVALGAIVTLGWVHLDSTVIDTIGTVLALLISAVLTIGARARTTPTADPRDDNGRSLVRKATPPPM